MEIPVGDIFFNNDTTFSAVYKKINELVKGDAFTAEIIDIKADTVTLKLNDGSVLTAKSQVIPEAKAGERVTLSVKENSNGVVKLEFVKNTGEMPESSVNNILRGLDMPPSEQGREVIRLLVRNELPLSRENVDKAMFYKYENPKASEESLVFILKENIPAQKNTLSVLEGILDKSLSLDKNIVTVCEELAAGGSEDTEKIFKALEEAFGKETKFDGLKNTENNEMGNKISGFFGKEKYISHIEGKASPVIFDRAAEDKNPQEVFKRAVERLFIRLNEEENGKNIIKGLSKIYELAKKGEVLSEKNTVLDKALENIKNNLEFSGNLNGDRQYIQIPFIMQDGKEGQCELYVFNNKKNTEKHDGSISALVGLDTAFLGRVEAYVVKSQGSLSIQIKADSQEGLALMKKEFSRLEEGLKGRGFSISAISFKAMDEPFKLTDKNPFEDGENENMENNRKKRFSFDMRI